MCVCVDILLETFFTRPTEMCMCAHSPFVVSDKVFMCVCVFVTRAMTECMLGPRARETQ